ncbi:MAG TPA: M23 family metallopeptidase, partial [bacterium]|nr:M23 family metallopeptidase [bacterium]
WKQYCPNNVTQGTTTVHADIMKDLPAFLKKKFATSITSVQEQQPTEQIAAAALKEKTIFKPQISFAGITEGISLPDYMNLMYKYLMSFALVVTGFVIVIGGVKYMIGQNDGIPMIKNAFIGVLLLSGTYVILKTVSPGTVNMNIIEINDISRKTTTNNNVAQTGLGTVLTNAVATAAGDRSPSPAIEIGTGWYFPVSIEDVDVKNFKYNATSKSAGGSFGYWRRTNKYALEHTPDYPVVCHHAVDIYTNKPGKVVAITDGVIVASGNSFANCSGGQTGSLIIQHKDKNGNTFIARYGEVDIVDTAKHKPGATVKAGESLGNATRCGMLHFELHAKGNVLAPKWRMPASLLTDMLSDYKTPQSIKDLYQVQGNTITNIEKFENESALKGKNCLDSPTALNYLVQDKANNGQYLLNPSSFLINLWNKTGDINKQITE